VHTSPARLCKAEQAFWPAWMRLPRPIAAGKRRVEEIALVVEWLPEEWPDGVPSVKQLLVVALLLVPILLLFAAELTFLVRAPCRLESRSRSNRKRYK
jgi:hypothetical protein